MNLEKYKKIAIFATVLLAIFTATSVFATESESWRNDKPCGRRLSSLRPAKIDECLQAFCGNLPNGARLCLCLKSDETGETLISFESKDAPKKQWTVEVLPPMSFGREVFRLDSIDLNGDGREEQLFGLMVSQGQGMSVQQWTLWAIDGNTISNEIHVADYGVMSYLTCSTERKGALLLGSHWIPGWEPRRGDGLYIAAQWYELGCGGLYRTRTRPGIYHRYLFNLAEERGQELGKDRPSPIQWYSRKNTHMLVGPYPFE